MATVNEARWHWIEIWFRRKYANKYNSTSMLVWNSITQQRYSSFRWRLVWPKVASMDASTTNKSVPTNGLQSVYLDVSTGWWGGPWNTTQDGASHTWEPFCQSQVSSTLAFPEHLDIFSQPQPDFPAEAWSDSLIGRWPQGSDTSAAFEYLFYVPQSRWDWLELTRHFWILVWVNTYRYIFSGMNIHLPAILMFTRGTRFWHTAIWDVSGQSIWNPTRSMGQISRSGALKTSSGNFICGLST